MRRRPDPVRDPLAVVVTAVVLAVAVVLLGGPAGHAVAAEDATIDGAQVRGSTLEFLLTTTARSSDGAIDAGSVHVTVGGMPATTTAAAATGDLVQRRVVLLIDTSGSMEANGIAAAKAAADALVGAVADDVLVGLVAFDDSPRVLVQPTTDRSAVLAAVAGLTAQDETALYDGIAAALASLGPAGDRTLVLLSDGGDTVSVGTLQSATAQLVASGVRAEVVGFRTDESQDATLQGLAAAGHGRVITAQDEAGLTRAFGSVATALSSQVQVTATLPEGITGGDQQVVVTATAGGRAVTASTVVALPTVRRDAPDAAPEPAPRAGAVVVAQDVPQLVATPWPAVGSIALLCGALVLLVAWGPRRRRPQTRMDQIAFFGLSGTPVKRSARTETGVVQRGQKVLDLAERFVRRRGMDEGLALLLDRADVPWRPHEYLVLRIAGASSALALAMVLSDSAPLRVIAPVVGWLVITAYVRWRARARIATVRRPAAGRVGARGIEPADRVQPEPGARRDLRATHAEPLRGQFARAMAEHRLGAELEDALERVAVRMDCEDLTWTVMAIRIQRQVGGNLAQTLRTTIATLRERASLRRQVKALSADGRLSAYVLIALPPVVVVAVSVLSPGYMSRLWAEPAGVISLAIGTLGMVVGTFWIQRLVKVDL